MLFPVQNRFRERRSLDGLWRFRMDEAEIGTRENWQAGLAGWMELAVPASWNDQTQDPALRTHLGSGWYERKVWIPLEWRTKRVVIRFGAVNYRADVWLNGEFLGSHEGGYTPFEVDVTSTAEFGEENLLVVRADCRLSADTVPMGNFPQELGSTNYYGQYPSTAGDFFPYCGINRSVLLCATPVARISDVAVGPSVHEDGSATVSLSASITGGNEPMSLSAALLDESGYEVAEARCAEEGGVLEAGLHVDAPKLWAPGDPNLYTLVLRLHVDSEVVDQYSLPIGIREVSIDGDRLCVNGKAVYLRGFGRHEDFHVIGRGQNDAVMVKDFSLMQWCGANSFRTTHYPYAEEQLYLADRLGILVIDEVPAVSLAMRAVTERTLESHKAQMREMVQRDRNHPCVIAWSVANEADTWRAEADDYFADVGREIRYLDSTRPSMIVLYSTPSLERVAQHYDLIGFNRYIGWYQYPGQLRAAAEELSAQLDELYDRFRRPIVVTEFGADAVHGLHSDPPEMYTEEYQSELIKVYLEVFRSKAYVVGEHVWNLADFKTQQHIRRVFYNHKGVFTRDRQPKMAAHTLRAMWASDADGAQGREGSG